MIHEIGMKNKKFTVNGKSVWDLNEDEKTALNNYFQEVKDLPFLYSEK